MPRPIFRSQINLLVMDCKLFFQIWIRLISKKKVRF